MLYVPDMPLGKVTSAEKLPVVSVVMDSGNWYTN